MTMPPRLQVFVDSLARFPWKSTALTLRQRFREDHLGLTASSLTFTTTIALVPLLTVALAVFTAFPMFAKFQDVLQKWLIDSLIPDNIARQVLGYLTQFAGKANRLGAAGLAALVITALTLVFTIDRTLNTIWRVRRPRPLGQRMLIYWAAITVGPLLLGASLSITSYVLTASREVVDGFPGGLRLLLDTLEFGLVAGAMAITYRFVPNTFVKWSHAWVGGLFAAAGIEVAKKLLAIYLGLVPTYSVVYGAFATLPILLVWIYLAWVMVLLGAVTAAYLPSLLSGVQRRFLANGWEFQLAMEVLQQLQQARVQTEKGLSLSELSARLRVDPLYLEPVLENLIALDWVGEISEPEPRRGARHVLLADPPSTLLAPLVQRLLLRRDSSTQAVWDKGGLSALRLSDVL
jgi:membrane protein